LNKNKNIVLITKHKNNIYNSLQNYKISKDLFSEIVHLSFNDEKYKYIKKDSIFIDDSFVERKKVKDNLNIPVFSIENIEALI
jgi:hypothetical protein